MHMVVVFKFTGLLQQMNIGKFLQRKNIFTLTVDRNQLQTTTTTAAGITPSSTTLKPHYYNLTVTKRTPYASFASSQPKPKMSNSFELLTGPIANIQKQYEMLSDIVTEHGGRVHGSQRDRDSKTGLMDLLVYYEVPQGQREEVKQKFDNIRNQIVTK